MSKRIFENALKYFQSGAKTAAEKISREDLIEIGILGSDIDKMTKVAKYMASVQEEEFIRTLEKRATSDTSTDKTIMQADYLGETQGEKARVDHKEKNTDFLDHELNSEEEKAINIVEDLLAKKKLELLDGSSTGEVLSEYDDTEGEVFGDGKASGSTKSSSDKRLNLLNSLLGL